MDKPFALSSREQTPSPYPAGQGNSPHPSLSSFLFFPGRPNWAGSLYYTISLTLVNKVNLLPQLHDGLCSAVLWVTSVPAAGLRRHLPLSESLDLLPRLPQGHPGASTLTSSLPMSTERFPPHLFSLSPLFHLCLTDNEVYKCCLVSSICLGHQKMCPAVSGGVVTQFRQSCLHAPLLPMSCCCQAAALVWEEK